MYRCLRFMGLGKRVAYPEPVVAGVGVDPDRQDVEVALPDPRHLKEGGKKEKT